ncbi:MAG TPA: hypothetical protein VGP33_11170 [Chloroflexota bacterium]|jgi:hypothetical protein|nr:hypothetical protein [Chloroflexota bacterium]
MGNGKFCLRVDIQGRQQQEERDLSATQAQEFLNRQMESWFEAPQQLLHLTCGDIRFTVLKAEDGGEAVARQPMATASFVDSADTVTEQSEESFPASDPPSSTGSIAGSLRR